METKFGCALVQILLRGSRCKTCDVGGCLWLRGTLANVSIACKSSSFNWWYGQGVFTELYGTYDGVYSVGGSSMTFLSTSSTIGGVTRSGNKCWARVKNVQNMGTCSTFHKRLYSRNEKRKLRVLYMVLVVFVSWDKFKSDFIYYIFSIWKFYSNQFLQQFYYMEY